MWYCAVFCKNYFLDFLAIVGKDAYVPKPSGLINGRELEICGRVRDLRERIGWGQHEFGKAIGVTRHRIGGVEYGRNTLRFWLADRICQTFDVCQLWLATGEGPIRGYVQFPPEKGLDIGNRELFSVAFHRLLEHRIRQVIREGQAWAERAFSAADSAGVDRLSEDFAYNLTRVFFSKVPMGLKQEFYGYISAAASAFIQHHREKFQGLEDSEKKELTSDYASRNNASVKSPMKALLGRVSQATKLRGKKAALAKFLNVPRPRVSEWLHGAGEPSGEVTLRLLEWVEAEEAQQKTPGGATNAAKGKTRSIHSKDETNKSGPIKS